MASFLLDQMMPARLCTALAGDLGEVAHVRELGLAEASDRDVFAYARDSGTTIITKDADFQSLLALSGPPPRVVWLRIGNATTNATVEVLHHHAEVIREFHDSHAACLVIRGR